MDVRKTLDMVYEAAKNDKEFKAVLLASRGEKDPITAFCGACAEKGFTIDPIEFISAGEDAYAEMKRSTNGGGANSPMIDGEDDLYAIFMTELEFFC